MAKRILVVDDEPDIVTVLKMGLKRKGYEVITAYDGKEALEKAKAERPDLITLDVMMPEVDGYTVCRELKNSDEHQAIKIIILTAKDQAEDMQQGKEARADLYMTKPFDMDELFEKIQNLIG